jgi:long-chain acyl-CoA synthetase
LSEIDNVINAKTIAEAFWSRVALQPHVLLYRYAVASSASATRVWRQETYGSAGEKIARLARYLSKLGVGPGVSVAIISNTRPEWMLADMAIQSLGGIAVSIYQSLTAVEAGFIIHDSGAKVIFIENEEQALKVAWLRANSCPIPEREDIPASELRIDIPHVISFENVTALTDIPVARNIFEDTTLPNTPPTLPTGLSRDCVASYVYTSGTTGAPKGVIQTNGNHLANVDQATESGVFAGDGSLFLYLPLAHSFARLIYYVGFLTPAHLILPAITDHRTSKLDLASTARDIREGSAFVVPSVPRLFEKMASVIKTRAEGTGLSSRILKLCLSNACKMQRHNEHGTKPGLLDKLIFDGLASIRAKVKRQLFGDNFRHAISGGARLDPEVNRFFDSLGIMICEGYGLTETCVATHVNLPNKRKIGSVGPAFRDLEVQISPTDGEIWMRGPNVTKGYLNRPLATKEAWSADGWFKSGDIGRLDEQGFLYITDRKKELVITAGGKKIPPTALEGMFKRCAFVSHAFLYGDGRPYCVMLFTLNELEIRAQLAKNGAGIPADQPLSRHPTILSKIEQAVLDVNRELASYESIKKFAILDEDFSIENGLLTPTLKMKRKLIVERYRSIIDSLYQD